MTTLSDKAFVLAAGKGTRMRPLTDTCPKPMLAAGGQSLIDYALDALAEQGIGEAIVNLNHLGEQIEAHLKNRAAPRIAFSHEDELLDTGGGVKRCLGSFGGKPFFVLNSDVVWTGGTAPALKRLADNWDERHTDILLLTQPLDCAGSFEGQGDFFLEPDGRLRFRDAATEDRAPLVFAGPRIVHPRIFDDTPDGAFSFLDLFKKAAKAGRLRGVVHDGDWFHAGTPDALAETDRILRERAAA